MPRARRNPDTGLTDQEMAFIHAFVETGNATAAYRRAYDAGKMNYASIRKEASRLLDNPHITPTLTILRRTLVDRAHASLMEHLAELDRLKRRAEDEGDMRAAVKAEELRGKVMGYHVERVEKGKPGEFDHLTDEELKKELSTYRGMQATRKKARDWVVALDQRGRRARQAKKDGQVAKA